jgi:hypothetical protein
VLVKKTKRLVPCAAERGFGERLFRLGEGQNPQLNSGIFDRSVTMSLHSIYVTHDINMFDLIPLYDTNLKTTVVTVKFV